MAMSKIGHSQGFTLIEILVVLAIIAILSMLALPAPEATLTRKQVAESLELIEDFKKLALVNYKLTAEFPVDNKALGIPKPELLLGNYVTKIELEAGAFHLYFGNKATGFIKDKILTVRPVVVKGSPQSPASWICGNSEVPNAMTGVGDNKTSIEDRYLPIACRDL